MREHSSVLINPATEQELRTVERVDEAGVDDAVARATVAQRSWAALPPADRAAALRAFAAAVDAHVDELAALEVANSGHPIGNATVGGRARPRRAAVLLLPARNGCRASRFRLRADSTSRSTSRSASSV